METLSEINRQLPTAGTIRMSQVNTELKKLETSMISLNDDSVRALAGKLSGEVSLKNLHGKSSSNQSSTGIRSMVNERPPSYDNCNERESISARATCFVKQGYSNMKISVNANIKLLHTKRDTEGKVGTRNYLYQGTFTELGWTEYDTAIGDWGTELTKAVPTRPIGEENNDGCVEIKLKDLDATSKCVYSLERTNAGLQSFLEIRAYRQGDLCYANIRLFVPARPSDTYYRLSMSYDIGITVSV